MLPGDPSELRLHISYDDELFDTPQADTLERWDVSILHRGFGHDAARCSARPGECVTPNCSAKAVEDVVVGSMTFFKVHLDRGRNAFWAMEEESEELYEAAQVLLDPATGNFTDEVGEVLEYVGSALLVMDRVTLQEPWRGHGLGAVLAMEAMYRLMAGCRAVACSPGVTDLSGNRLKDRAEWDRVYAKIAQGGARRVSALPGQRLSPLARLAGVGRAARSAPCAIRGTRRHLGRYTSSAHVDVTGVRSRSPMCPSAWSVGSRIPACSRRRACGRGR